ncbi:hypothetical protein Avbf_17708, partial [Armadillidium vulgare]
RVKLQTQRKFLYTQLKVSSSLQRKGKTATPKEKNNKYPWLYFLTERKDIDSMFFNIVIIILIILNNHVYGYVKPVAASKASKKQRTSIADNYA